MASLARLPVLFPRPLVHAVYVLCHLSRQDADTVTSARAIARSMNVPPEQASKILQALAAAGLVVAHRGRQGGYTLGRDPAQITLADVFSAVTESDGQNRLRARSCPMTRDAVCSACSGLSRLYERFWTLMCQESLAALLSESPGLRPGATLAGDPRPS